MLIVPLRKLTTGEIVNFKKYNGYQASGSLYYSYGQFTRNITLYICNKDVIFDGLIENSQAGVNYDADSLQWEFWGNHSIINS